MNIVLLGANGRTGREVLGQALSAGDTVTALVRAEDKLGEVGHERLEVRVGDACDPRVLEAILPGHDVVISTLGPRLPTKAATAVYSASGASIVEAMEGSAVNRLLVTSTALLFPSDKLLDRVLRRLTPNAVREAGRMEERIRSSGLDWTIARMGFLTNDPDTGFRRAAGASPEGGKPISRAAVARFLLGEARESAHVREVVGLSG
ncbi:MAG: NAD(P)H-binding protein [Gammaproteobacteria bacterium]|nr:NAD(P)H-binding protein [Gammaproteobacteria bacterium]